MTTDQDHQILLDSIYRITGNKISYDKLYLLESRLKGLMGEKGLSNFTQVAQVLNRGEDTDFINQVIDNIATHETHFIRDEIVFEAFVEQIIPEWMQRKGIDPAQPQDVGLKIWSAGCSTGQEAYSILMLLGEYFPYLLSNLKLFASDISLDTIRKAREGKYTNFEISRGLPDHLRRKYFTETGDGFQIQEKLRQKVEFVQHNLNEDPFPGGFDIVFCRNTLIYFTLEDKRRILENIRKSLKQDGILILGSAESLTGIIGNFIMRNYKRTHYYELNSSKVTLF